eukprot:CAMPEP_0174997430 /NCGR_PEP_ID=MMETSP0005-20121125/949_1 /TAXON_ID=420556 /ORGANISM="Ochromonas sp., Strain CCMP1393" /LENGTH=926 /DNA_ID=CAMNT_0016251955 /DNA_START=109 /DNA_END=2891 /DNA_ORIENTATION=+
MSQSVILAGPGVLIGAALMGVIAKAILPYNWNWNLAMTFGSILAATDTVAVVSLLKTVGASPKLTMVTVGESLLNDGTAMVLFTVSINCFNGDRYSPGEVVLYFLGATLGSVLFGSIVGVMAVRWMETANRPLSDLDPLVQIAITICTAYLTFFVGQQTLVISGVLSCCTAGFMISWLGPPIILNHDSMKNIWATIEWSMNTFIFLLAGLIIGHRVFEHVTHMDWLFVFVLYVFLNLVRFFVIGVCFPIVSRLGHGLTVNEAAFMSWGGLRGALAMSLALITYRNGPEDMRPETSRLFFYVGGIAALSMLINAPSALSLLYGLDLVGVESAEKSMVMVSIQKKLRAHLRIVLRQLVKEFHFSEKDVDEIRHSVSLLENTSTAELMGGGDADAGAAGGGGGEGEPHRGLEKTVSFISGRSHVAGFHRTPRASMTETTSGGGGGAEEDVAIERGITLDVSPSMLASNSGSQKRFSSSPSKMTPVREQHSDDDDDDIGFENLKPVKVGEKSKTSQETNPDPADVAATSNHSYGALSGLEEGLEGVISKVSDDSGEGGVELGNLVKNPMMQRQRIGGGENNTPSPTKRGGFFGGAADASPLTQIARQFSFDGKGGQRSGKHGSARLLHKELSFSAKNQAETISPTLLYYVRSIFLAMVRVSYWHDIEQGKLPRISKAGKFLLYSVEVGLDQVEIGDGQRDWKCVEAHLQQRPWMIQLLTVWEDHIPEDWCMKIPSKLLNRLECTLEEDNVYILTSFIAAHEHAQERIHGFLVSDQGGSSDIGGGGEEGDLDAALGLSSAEELKVIAESKLAVELAKARLAAVNPETIGAIRTKQAAALILNQEADMVGSMVKQGLLTRRDAEDIIEHINRDMAAIELKRTKMYREHGDSSSKRRKALHKYSSVALREISTPKIVSKQAGDYDGLIAGEAR